jgi:hypothetical protein
MTVLPLSGRIRSACPSSGRLSTEVMAQPTKTALAAQVATVFKGEPLRGLLVNAYAFGTVGTIVCMAPSPSSSPARSC